MENVTQYPKKFSFFSHGWRCPWGMVPLKGGWCELGEQLEVQTETPAARLSLNTALLGLEKKE